MVVQVPIVVEVRVQVEVEEVVRSFFNRSSSGCLFFPRNDFCWRCRCRWLCSCFGRLSLYRTFLSLNRWFWWLFGAWFLSLKAWFVKW